MIHCHHRAQVQLRSDAVRQYLILCDNQFSYLLYRRWLCTLFRYICLFQHKSAAYSPFHWYYLQFFEIFFICYYISPKLRLRINIFGMLFGIFANNKIESMIICCRRIHNGRWIWMGLFCRLKRDYVTHGANIAKHLTTIKTNINNLSNEWILRCMSFGVNQHNHYLNDFISHSISLLHCREKNIFQTVLKTLISFIFSDEYLRSYRCPKTNTIFVGCALRFR